PATAGSKSQRQRTSSHGDRYSTDRATQRAVDGRTIRREPETGDRRVGINSAKWNAVGGFRSSGIERMEGDARCERYTHPKQSSPLKRGEPVGKDFAHGGPRCSRIVFALGTERSGLAPANSEHHAQGIRVHTSGTTARTVD